MRTDHHNSNETEVIRKSISGIFKMDLIKLGAMLFLAGGFYFVTDSRVSAIEGQLKPMKLELDDLAKQYARIESKLDAITERQNMILQAFKLTPSTQRNYE